MSSAVRMLGVGRRRAVSLGVARWIQAKGELLKSSDGNSRFFQIALRHSSATVISALLSPRDTNSQLMCCM